MLCGGLSTREVAEPQSLRAGSTLSDSDKEPAADGRENLRHLGAGETQIGGERSGRAKWARAEGRVGWEALLQVRRKKPKAWEKRPRSD